MEAIKQISLAEYIELYEREGAFEIINGERRPIMPPVAIHVWLIRALFRILDERCRQGDLGELLQEMPYVLTYDSNWVKGSRVPDLMFFAKARWQDYMKNTPDWASKPAILVPDLVVEVVSANDRFSEINEKVRVYEDDKVGLIWIIDPAKKTVDVYEDGKRTALSEKDTLTGGKILPELRVNLKEFFTLPSA
jgi:Uma2 family endonuclease